MHCLHFLWRWVIVHMLSISFLYRTRRTVHASHRAHDERCIDWVHHTLVKHALEYCAMQSGMSPSDLKFIFSQKNLCGNKYPVRLSGIGKELLAADSRTQSKELYEGLSYLDDVLHHRRNAYLVQDMQENLERSYAALHRHFVGYFSEYPPKFEEIQERGRYIPDESEELKRNISSSFRTLKKGRKKPIAMDLDDNEFSAQPTHFANPKRTDMRGGRISMRARAWDTLPIRHQTFHFGSVSSSVLLRFDPMLPSEFTGRVEVILDVSKKTDLRHFGSN